jgi:hypothetical protein
MAETVTALDDHRPPKAAVKKKKLKKAKMAKAPKEPAAPKEHKTRKETKEAAQGLVGRDLGNLAATAEGQFKALFQIQKDMDEDMAGYRGQFAAAYETAASELGVKKSFLIKEYKRALRIKREIAKEHMLNNDEAAEIDALRELMGGTALGDWFAGSVSRPAAT